VYLEAYTIGLLLALNFVIWLVIRCLFAWVCMDREVVVLDNMRNLLTLCGDLDVSLKILTRMFGFVTRAHLRELL
jgi:hypothetical protein